MSVQRRERGGRVRWVGRYRDPAGKERSRTFDTRREAAAWVADRERDVRRGDWTDPAAGRTTIGDLMTQWAARADRESTAVHRRGVAANLGALADMPIGAVRPADVDAWLSTLVRGRPWADGTPMAPTTAATYRAVLAGALADAVRRGIIARNPATGVRPPRTTTGQRVHRADIPTAAQVRLLVDVWRDGITGPDGRWVVRPAPMWALMAEVAASTGMRASEIAGMTVDALDAPAGVVHVRRQAMADGRLGPLKTPSSERSIMVAGETMGRLRRWAAGHPSADGRLWVRPQGGPMTGSAMAAQMVRTVRRVPALAGLRWHALRHFHASVLLQAGVSIPVVQRRLGHASASVTLDVYAHVMPGDDAAAARVVGDVLSGAGPVRDGTGGVRAL